MLTLDPIIFKLESWIPGLSPDQALALFEAEATEHGLSFSRIVDHQHRIETEIGMIDIAIFDKVVRLKVSAPNKEDVYLLKESIDDHIKHALNQTNSPLIWSGDLPQDLMPPNFRKARITSVQPIGHTYIRITLAADDIDRFFEGGMHFRLLFPKKSGNDPVWPYIDEDGRTIWPTGDQELMRPVYTVRKIDKEKPAFDFDVFLHEGGPTAEWACQAKKGDEIGLMGPSGGWIPQADYFLLAGDETAIPAIARILETLPPTSRGQVFLSVKKQDDQLKITHPQGMTLEWVVRQDGAHEKLLERASQAVLPERGDVFVWFAAKKSEARKAKHHFRGEKGFNTKNSYIAGYWEET
ncbi:MAG: siderophore-interacting protein [Cohaesibacter sp.]|nr:siderophore-interacting protein [Cohaesibacter sp.]